MLYNDLPLKTDPANRFLPWIVALMIYLATLAITISFSVNLLISQWEKGFESHVTIEIPVTSQPQDDAVLMEKVIFLLKKIPEVGTVKVLSATELLKSLNQSTLTPLDESILPKLLDVEFTKRNDHELSLLKENLKILSPAIMLEDHLDWKEGLFELAQATQIISSFILGIIIAATMGTIAFTSQTSLIMHRNIIELLYLMGAENTYIAKQFQTHTFHIGFKGAIYGTTLSVLTFFLIQFFAHQLNIQILAPLFSNFLLWGVVLIVPICVIGFMILSAKTTVRLTLRNTL